MTILPQLKRELSAAARRLDSRQGRRWRGVGRRSLLLIPVVLVALGGLALAATQTFKPSHHHRRPFASSQYRQGHCPADVLPLGPHAFAAAKRAAMRQADVAYPHRDLRGTRAVGAQLVTRGSPRSADAQRCGLLGRTVLVDLRLPAPFHSASLSEGAVYVSRIRQPGRAASYQLWGLEH